MTKYKINPSQSGEGTKEASRPSVTIDYQVSGTVRLDPDGYDPDRLTEGFTTVELIKYLTDVINAAPYHGSNLAFLLDWDMLESDSITEVDVWVEVSP